MSDNTPSKAEKRGRFPSRTPKARPTRPGEIYGVPGQGDTLWLSLATIVILLFGWWLVTALGWVRPGR